MHLKIDRGIYLTADLLPTWWLLYIVYCGKATFLKLQEEEERFQKQRWSQGSWVKRNSTLIMLSSYQCTHQDSTSTTVNSKVTGRVLYLWEYMVMLLLDHLGSQPGNQHELNMGDFFLNSFIMQNSVKTRLPRHCLPLIFQFNEIEFPGELKFSSTQCESGWIKI